MDKFIKPLNTGQSARRERWKRTRKVLRNQRLLKTVLSVANAIAQVARLIGNIVDGF